MRTVVILSLVLLVIVVVQIVPPARAAEALQSSSVAERASALEEARARRAAAQALADALEREIARAEANAPTPGKRARARGGGKIVNGVRTWSYPTAGALILGADAASALSQCTGTLIGPQTFLTAAHCVEDDTDPASYHVFLQHGGIVAVASIASHPDYRFPHADLAVLHLDRPVHGLVPTALRTEPVPNGSVGDIVGFGRAGGADTSYGIKRAGKVRTAPCNRPETSLLCWNYDDNVGAAGLDSNTCNIDSGGPLYVQPGGSDAPLLLAGITSGGSRRNCLQGDHSYDVDVRQFAQWIETTAGEGLGAALATDTLPAWGSDEVSVLATEIVFDAALRERRYAVPVPPGTLLLRVAMNGQDEFPRDFDLFVAAGRDATPTDNDCAQDGSGQYAFCAFEAPVAGNWSILVRAKAGSGLAQLTATVFEP